MKTIALKTVLALFSLVFAGLMAYGQEAEARKVVKLKVIKDDKTVLDTVITKTGNVGEEDISRIIKTAGGHEVYVMVTDEGDGAGDHGLVTVSSGKDGEKIVRVKKIVVSGKDSCIEKTEADSAECSHVAVAVLPGEKGLIRVEENVAVLEPLSGETENQIIVREGIPLPLTWMEKEHDGNGIQLKNLGEGSFRLSYRSEDLKPIRIEVFDGEGNRLFSQKVRNFLGKYVKDIYLAENDPGFYVIRVRQGSKEEIGEFQIK